MSADSTSTSVSISDRFLEYEGIENSDVIQVEDMDDQRLTDLTEYLKIKNVIRLDYLDIEGEFTTLDSVALILAQNKKIQYLHLTGNFTDLSPLLEHLSSDDSTSLIQLRLIGKFIDLSPLKLLIKHANLRKLILEGDFSDLGPLETVLRRNNNLKELELRGNFTDLDSFGRGLVWNTRLERLVMFFPITDEPIDLVPLVKALEYNKTLQSLDLNIDKYNYHVVLGVLQKIPKVHTNISLRVADNVTLKKYRKEHPEKDYVDPTYGGFYQSSLATDITVRKNGHRFKIMGPQSEMASAGHLRNLVNLKPGEILQNEKGVFICSGRSQWGTLQMFPEFESLQIIQTPSLHLQQAYLKAKIVLEREQRAKRLAIEESGTATAVDVPQVLTIGHLPREVVKMIYYWMIGLDPDATYYKDLPLYRGVDPRRTTTPTTTRRLALESSSATVSEDDDETRKTQKRKGR